ncbi:MAG: hypothetical protein JXA30_17130 [Deltaproteobacteria bacterium]|nr:hypothetical protein [Deltaproteobacteria bacterium]
MRQLIFALIIVTTLLVSSAFAQKDEQLPSVNGGEPTAEATLEGQSEVDLSGTAEKEPDANKPLAWFVGLQGRLNWIPPVFPELFLEEAPAVVGPGFTVTGSWRSNSESGFGVTFGIGYLDYSADGPYRDKGDPETDTEFIESSLGMVYLSGTMFWSTRFGEMFAFEYGFGLDFGIVTGEIKRTEAYPDPGSDTGWAACEGPQPPGAPNAAYCAYPAVGVNEEGEHYGVVEDSIPPVFALPAIPQLALRFEPDPMVALKLQVAYGIVQFCFGLAAEIGVEAL